MSAEGFSQPAAVAFCPHPPLLVSELGAGEPVAVRPHAIAAARWLARFPIERIVVLGSAEAAAYYAPGSEGSFTGYGVDLTVRLPGERVAQEPRSPLPLSLAVGAWLLQQAAWDGTAEGVTCDVAGRLPELAVALGPADALLVMGDGSARRTEKAPGWFDERADGFDAQVSAALLSGDPEWLAHLDPELGGQLLAAGVPAWRAAARLLVGTTWQAGVSYDDAPYGVGYFVASWSPAPQG